MNWNIYSHVGIKFELGVGVGVVLLWIIIYRVLDVQKYAYMQGVIYSEKKIYFFLLVVKPT